VSRTQVDRNEEAIARAKAFDWWFSQFNGLYNTMLTLSWGRRHRRALPYIRGPRVLEVSFGMGYLMSQYADRFDTTGIDYNPRYIEVTGRRLKAKKIDAKLLHGDAHALPFPDASFETLVNTDAFTLYENPKKAMSEFYRVLVPGGQLVLMEYDYPRDGNLLGRLWVEWARLLKVPYIDFNTLLTSTGFTFEDHPVGNFGMLHMYVATKPLSATTAADANAQGVSAG